jgi:hypothetical protein
VIFALTEETLQTVDRLHQPQEPKKLVNIRELIVQSLVDNFEQKLTAPKFAIETPILDPSE